MLKARCSQTKRQTCKAGVPRVKFTLTRSPQPERKNNPAARRGVRAMQGAR